MARPPQDPDDDFSEFDPTGQRQTALLNPTPPKPRRQIRYDLLAGAALIIALLALLPLLLFRDDPEEIPTSAEIPSAGAPREGDVRIDLDEPTDLTDKVRLSWRSSRELDFAVVVAAEGEDPRVLLAERNHTMTVDVDPGRKYCFQIQATDGSPPVYESDPVPLRGATCRRR